MKSLLKLLVVLCAIMVLTNESYGQFAFGVSPGIGLNSAYFGYNLNPTFSKISLNYYF